MNAVLDAPALPLDRLGRPLRDLRLSVIEACNFRCGYCMPADRVRDDHGMDAASRLSFDEIETLVRGFARLGVSKLRLTGGEPLTRRELPRLVAMLAAQPGLEDLTLTTNGSLLAGQAEALHRAGLHRLTVSLDTLDPEIFRRMNDAEYGPEEVLAGIAAAERAGFARIKVNCVVRRGANESSPVELVEKFRGGPVGLETIAASISEEADTIMDVYEPYLIQLGMLARTPRGREATPRAYEHLGLPAKGSPPSQQRPLFEAPG